MTVGSNIESRTSTTLAMTPRLQQAIRMLQLSVTELDAFLNEQAEENPLLTVENNDVSLASAEESPQEFSPDHDDEYISESSSFEERDPGQETHTQNPRLRSEQTLQEYLQVQLSAIVNTNEEYRIGLLLINSLNSYGYLEIDADEISKQLNVDANLVQTMINRMQKFDPVGIFSRNVSECLRIQLEEKNLLTSEMNIVLQNLEGLIQGNPTTLAKKCGLSIESLQKSLQLLRTLNPRPASGFLTNTLNDNVIPDGFVVRDADGNFIFEINPNTIPKVFINSPYYFDLKQRLKKADEKQFLQAKFAHANWLIQALHQRISTLQKVATAITEHQQEFFLYGMKGLKSLNLKTIADQLGIHESTVSRITNSKFVSTPRGTFELKFFFSQSLTSISYGQEDVSAKSVQNAILDLIKKESESAPLSDEQLVSKLAERGMIVARRTISKYRKILKIPSSQERRNSYTFGLKKA